MVKMKFCGLTRIEDIEAVNELKPAYIGFVFAKKSRRYISFEQAAELKKHLLPEIQAVGVFVDEPIPVIADLLNRGIIDLAQLHGSETEEEVLQLKALTGKPVIRAFRITDENDIAAAKKSVADYCLLDSGAGTGTVFDWKLIREIDRPFFLAGGLDPENVREALITLHPYAVDVSSGIETDGIKDKRKMAAFAAEVRKETR